MKRFFYICGMAAGLLASGCGETAQVPGTEGEDATFQVFTRANEAPSVDQKAWLYLATRETESENTLSCTTTFDVGTGYFTLENKVSQWYKMAFVCVPYGATAKVELPEPTGEFNDIVLDYTPVLNVTGQSETEDLAIYRKVIDRWLIPGENLNEDVTMSRITGQLVLDMGILKDQFPKKVTKITVTLTGIPAKVYLRDNSNEEVIYPENSTVEAQTYSFENPNWGDDGTHFRMCFNLLPCTISGSKQITEGQATTVSGCRVKVEYEGGVEEYPIGTADPIDPSVQIRKDLRTTVYFNGMENGEFEVRYAGFDGTSIGVDSDDWDGWNTNE